jgi:microtubule-associated serine/threonine kinase
LLSEFYPRTEKLADATYEFVLNQIIEAIRNILDKSQAMELSSLYFFQMTESINELYMRCANLARQPLEGPRLDETIRKLLLIISRPARLLECLEFDPKQFYYATFEEQVSGLSSSSHMPCYIKSQLDSLDDEAVQVADKTRCESPAPPETEPHESPTEEDFPIVKLISSGAYGAVYLVKHKKLKRRFAMKKVNKQNMIRKKQVDQVFTERDILTFADNPFVVSIYCSFQTKKHLCMIMEYVEGGDCATLLKNMGGPIPVDLTRLYIAETVLAVEYIHNLGVVHRDIKPENMLITSEGHIKLTDFGLSKIGLMNMTTGIFEQAHQDDSLFLDEQIYGTPDYIAPEVILMQGYGKPVDWWSVGIVLYEFLIGVPPLWAESVEELFDLIKSETMTVEWPLDPEEAPPWEAQDLVHSLLKQNPADRLGSVQMGGVAGVKSHRFFERVSWRSLLLQKAVFVPQLENEEDTSYFDPRTDRYSHEFLSDGEDEADEYSMPFQNFASTSARYSMILETHDEGSELPPHVDTQESTSIPSVNQPTIPGLSIQGPSSSSSSSSSGSYATSPTKEEGSSGPRRKQGRDETSPTSGVPPVDLDTVRQPVASAHWQMPAAEGGSRKDVGESPGLAGFRPSDLGLQTIIMEKGQGGYGMILRAIRVYIGDTEMYRMHHIVKSVDDDGPAWQAGLRPGQLVTHVNGKPVTGLLHTEVVQLIIAGGRSCELCTIPLESTPIRAGGRQRSQSLARRLSSTQDVGTGSSGHASRGKTHERKSSSLLFWRRKKKNKEQKERSKSSPASPTRSPPESPRRGITSSSSSLPRERRLPSPPQGSSSSSSSQRAHSFGFLPKLFRSPRRKPHGPGTPVSPLARTPSPAMTASPVATASPGGAWVSAGGGRSPSPLAPVGSRSRTSLGSMSISPPSAGPFSEDDAAEFSPGYSRSQSTGTHPSGRTSTSGTSPLLRRALSPDHMKSYSGSKLSESAPASPARGRKKQSSFSKMLRSRSFKQSHSKSSSGGDSPLGISRSWQARKDVFDNL